MTPSVRPCPHTPHCPKLQPCPDHPRIPYANARRSTNLYGTARWRRESRAFLAANPTCEQRIEVLVVDKALSSEEVAETWQRYQEAGSCGAPATVVDHRIPHRGNEVKFWQQGNWAALCKPHHQAKTGREVRYRKGGLKR